MLTLKGIATSPGIAVGTVITLESFNYIPKMQTVANPQAEYERVLIAVQVAKEQLHVLYEKALSAVGEESAIIFNSHVVMLEDADFLGSIHDIIYQSTCNGEYAVYVAAQQIISIFNHMEDEYMRERAADIEDVSNRIIRVLSGQDQEIPNEFFATDTPIIISTQILLPSQTFLYDRNQISGFISKHGSVKSHASLLARSLGIPSVSGLEDSYDQIKTGDYLIVDGMSGLVICQPNQSTLLEYSKAPN